MGHRWPFFPLHSAQLLFHTWLIMCGNSRDSVVPTIKRLHVTPICPFLSPSALYPLPISFFYNIFTTSTPVVSLAASTQTYRPRALRAPALVPGHTYSTLLCQFLYSTRPIHPPLSAILFSLSMQTPWKEMAEKKNELIATAIHIVAYWTFFFFLMLFYIYFFLILPCTKNQILSEIHNFKVVCICVSTYSN